MKAVRSTIMTQTVPIHRSAGGVICRTHNKKIQLVLLLYRKNTNSWHLPKGTAKDSETTIETALREVLEETGIHVKIVQFLGALESGFLRNKIWVQKVTSYFLMHPVSSIDVRLDAEHDLGAWVEIDEAIDLLRRTSQQLPELEQEYRILELAKEPVKRQLQDHTL
jgi:8-oxo-dGTP pyrophosphatase MutT (NUDIX family)